jgi:SAM-dependent methyltransferase
LTTVELPPRPQRAAISQHEYVRLARRAKQLSWLSLAYMGLEGGVALVAGFIAASPALIGFGIDSAIEGVASLVIVWRFTGARLLSEAAEQRAQRLVAVQFFLLAPYVGYESLNALLAGERPDASWLGIGLSITSLLVMPWLGWLKQRIGHRMGSVALQGEGQQNLLCSYLAAALLVGLAGNAVFGLWWLDPAAGLLIGFVALKEGLETWRGEGCCAPAASGSADCCVPAPTRDAECCNEDCCENHAATSGEAEMTGPRVAETYVPALGFDRLTALYDPVVRVTTREAAFKRRLLSQAALLPGERVLDLGCGTGTLSLWAKRSQPQADIVGLDGDPAGLSRARSKAKRFGLSVQFDQGLADRMPYSEGAFDKVLSSLFFHHLDAATRKRVMREIGRVLRPDGELHVADWGQPRGLVGPALFFPVRVLDGFEETADNASGRLPVLLREGGLVDVQTCGRLRAPLGSIDLISAKSGSD